MKSLYDASAVEEIEGRLGKLGPHSQRQWGRMTAPQMVAHCAIGFDMALGQLRPPRRFAGRFLGPLVRPLALGNDKPMRRSTPTIDEMVIEHDPDFDAEVARLRERIGRFAGGGPAVCTTHPHPFLGPLTPQEWATLMYKHLDHHLRQFGK